MNYEDLDILKKVFKKISMKLNKMQEEIDLIVKVMENKT